MSPRSRVLFATALACTALAVLPPAPALDVQLRASGTWADNLSRTSFAPTQKDAAIFSAGLSATHARQLAPNWTAIFSGELDAETVPDFDALDRAGAGAQATLRRKFGLGPFAPVLDLSASLQRNEFSESGRSHWRQEIVLSFAKRLTETLRLNASGRWERHEAKGAPYDVQNRRLAFEATWDATPRWRLRAGVSRLEGQLTANATGAIYAQALAGAFGTAIQNYYSSVPFGTTDTFGPGWVAYRVDGDADIWWAEASLAATDRTTLALRHEAVKFVNVVGVRYDTAFVSLHLAHRF